MAEQPAYFVKSVEKTFDVPEPSPRTPRLTVSRVAAKSDMTRASARRFLLTLTDLGYLRADGPYFELTPRSLDIGSRFWQTRRSRGSRSVTSNRWPQNSTKQVPVRPRRYRRRLRCLRPSPRILSVSISVGTRFPPRPRPWGGCCWAHCPTPTETTSIPCSCSGSRALDRQPRATAGRSGTAPRQGMVHGFAGTRGRPTRRGPSVWRGNEVVAAVNVPSRPTGRPRRPSKKLGAAPPRRRAADQPRLWRPRHRPHNMPPGDEMITRATSMKPLQGLPGWCAAPR